MHTESSITLNIRFFGRLSVAAWMVGSMGCFDPPQPDSSEGKTCIDTNECLSGDKDVNVICLDHACVLQPICLDETEVEDPSPRSTPSPQPVLMSAETCQLDILFVIDHSVTAENTHDALLATLTGENAWGLFLTLIDKDFHLGFTTASAVTENRLECRMFGSLMRGDLKNDSNEEEVCFYDDPLNGFPFVELGDGPEYSSLSTAVSCLTDKGTAGEYAECLPPGRPFFSALRATATTEDAEEPCNKGFGRPGVPLLVFIYTIADECASPDDCRAGLCTGIDIERTLPPCCGNDCHLSPELDSWWTRLIRDRQYVNEEDAKGKFALALISNEGTKGCSGSRADLLLGFGDNYVDESLYYHRDICAFQSMDEGARAEDLMTGLVGLINGLCEE